MTSFLCVYSAEEKIDIIVVLSQFLNDGVKEQMCNEGVVLKIPRNRKRLYFSELSKSTKHRCKDEILREFERYEEKAVADVMLTSLVDCSDAWAPYLESICNSCGLEIKRRSYSGIIQTVNDA